MMPTETTLEKLGNMGIGGALSAGGQWAGTTGATMLGERAARGTQDAAARQAQNAVRDDVLARGRELGFKVPLSEINPTHTNRMLETTAGKANMQQGTSANNQQVLDRVARSQIGLRPDAPVTEQTLEGMRKTAGQAYEAVKRAPIGKVNPDPDFAAATKSIGADFKTAAAEFPASTRNAAIENLSQDLTVGNWSPTGIVEKVKMLRKHPSANFKAFADPEKIALANAKRDAA
jgi:hypothetical protein